MYYEHIQQALDKVQATLSKEELEELLQENQSYLCAEFRPEFSDKLSVAVGNMDDSQQLAVIDSIDDLWIYILNQYVQTMHPTSLKPDPKYNNYYGVKHWYTDFSNLPDNEILVVAYDSTPFVAYPDGNRLVPINLAGSIPIYYPASRLEAWTFIQGVDYDDT